MNIAEKMELIRKQVLADFDPKYCMNCGSGKYWHPSKIMKVRLFQSLVTIGICPPRLSMYIRGRKYGEPRFTISPDIESFYCCIKVDRFLKYVEELLTIDEHKKTIDDLERIYGEIGVDN